MESPYSLADADLHQVEQINALIDYVRKAGVQALNEYQQEKFLGLTARQTILLATVLRQTRLLPLGVSLGALAREMHMSISAASHLVDTLVEHNLLVRHADEEDRRSVRISLSDNGRKCASIGSRGMLQAIRTLTADLTPEENAQRLRFIEKIYRKAYPET